MKFDEDDAEKFLLVLAQSLHTPEDIVTALKTQTDVTVIETTERVASMIEVLNQDSTAETTTGKIVLEALTATLREANEKFIQQRGHYDYKKILDKWRNEKPKLN